MRTYRAVWMEGYRERHQEGFGPVVSCACGCGATFRKFDYSHQERRFKQGHQRKGKVASGPCGCGCGREGTLVKGLVNICYQRRRRAEKETQPESSPEKAPGSHGERLNGRE